MNSLRAFGDKFGQRIGHRAEHMPHVRNSVMSGGPGPAALRIVTPSACESDGQTVRGRNKIACEMLQQHAVPGRVCRQYGGGWTCIMWPISAKMQPQHRQVHQQWRDGILQVSRLIFPHECSRSFLGPWSVALFFAGYCNLDGQYCVQTW